MQKNLPRLAASAFALALVTACSPSDVTGPSLRKEIQITAVRDPILFVHGWNSSAAAWNTMVAMFKADGYTDNELITWSYNTAQSNVTTAQLIRTKVDSILAATGAAHVDIVTHSMGTLSARYYIRNLKGGSKVDAIVSLGGPNHGTNTALACPQTSCLEMRPNSSFLRKLNQKDETWGTPRYLTWWTPCDQVIIPQQSTILSGATNTQTACMSHSQLHEDQTVYTQVRDLLG